MNKNLILISLGGSMVAPKEGFNTQYLLAFKNFILEQIKAGKQFFIVVGGGNTARRYQDAAKEVGCSEHSDLDGIGIKATSCNAELVRLLFGKLAYPEVIKSYDNAVEIGDYKIVIGSGWKPGFSTDFVLVTAAELYDGRKIVNLSNIDYVYDKDPHKCTDAKKIERISFDELLAIIGDDWVPGKNSPFDPIACKLAKKMGLSVYIANGSGFENLKNLFAGKPFKGTCIS